MAGRISFSPRKARLNGENSTCNESVQPYGFYFFFSFSPFIYFVRAKELPTSVLLFFRFILAALFRLYFGYVFNSKQLLYVTFAVNCKVTNCRQRWIGLQTERMQIHSVKSNFVTSQLPRFAWQQSLLHGNSVSKRRSARETMRPINLARVVSVASY